MPSERGVLKVALGALGVTSLEIELALPAVSGENALLNNIFTPGKELPRSIGGRLPHLEPLVKAGPGEPRKEVLDLFTLIEVVGAQVEFWEDAHAKRNVPIGRSVALRGVIGLQ